MFVRVTTTSQQQRRASAYSIYREELTEPTRNSVEKRRNSAATKPPSRRPSTFFIGLLKNVGEDDVLDEKAAKSDHVRKRKNENTLSVHHQASVEAPTTTKFRLKKRLCIALQPRICLVVGGKFFQTFESTLSNYPQTLLGNVESRGKYYNAASNTYVFERCASSFDTILFYYQSHGILSKPFNVKRSKFIEELDFFQIKEFLDPRHKLETAFCDQLVIDEDMPSSRKEKFVRRLLGLRRNSWMERVCYLLYLVVIGLSVFNICLETLEELQELKIWLYMEFVFCFLLTFEYCLHLLVAKRKCAYIFSFPGLMDLCAVLPTLVYVSFYIVGNTLELFQIPRILFRLIDFLRISRLIKCFQASRGLRQVLLVLYECREYIMLLVVSIIQACLIFSSLVYEVEDMNNMSMFPQYLDSLWYAIITATGVGYGDFYPQSLAGKFFGAALSVLGVLLFCLPTSKLVYKFVECFYLPYILTPDVWEEKRRKLMTERRNKFLEEMFF